ncbi:hypothetical protein NIHE141904_22420 [Enterobacter hormaechei]|nr:hypothetical protein NIHE141904_22420 [Enterobacter hormaechei]
MARLPDAGIVHGFEKKLDLLLDYMRKNAIKMILITFLYWIVGFPSFLMSYINLPL